MKLVQYFWLQTRGMFVLLLLTFAVFLPFFYYTVMGVETALLRRRVRLLKSERERLRGKNAALRLEADRLTRIYRARSRSGKTGEFPVILLRSPRQAEKAASRKRPDRF